MTINKAMIFAAALTVVVSIMGLGVETNWVLKATNGAIILQWSTILVVCIFNHFGEILAEKQKALEDEYMGIINDETPVDRESIPLAVRRFVIERDAFTCSYCYSEGEPDRDADGQAWHIDHALPVSRGGRTHPNNLTLSCTRCNLSKGSKTPVEFMRYRNRPPIQAKRLRIKGTKNVPFGMGKERYRRQE